MLCPLCLGELPLVPMSLNLLADAKQEVDRDYKELGSPDTKAESKARSVPAARSSADADVAESKQSSATAPFERKIADSANEHDDGDGNSAPASGGAAHASATAAHLLENQGLR